MSIATRLVTRDFIHLEQREEKAVQLCLIFSCNPPIDTVLYTVWRDQLSEETKTWHYQEWTMQDVERRTRMAERTDL